MLPVLHQFDAFTYRMGVKLIFSVTTPTFIDLKLHLAL